MWLDYTELQTVFQLQVTQVIIKADDPSELYVTYFSSPRY